MTINAASLNTAFEAGTTVTVTLTKGDPITGEYVSTNSKGVNLRVDGKLVTRSLGRVASVDRVEADADGLTTAQLAAVFHTNARSLRVHLRRLGLGVGQGRTYQLSAADVEKVRAALSA